MESSGYFGLGDDSTLWGSVVKAVQDAAAVRSPAVTQPFGGFPGAFRDRVDQILSPHMAHAIDAISGNFGSSRETEDILSKAFEQGKTRAQIQQERDRDDAAKAAVRTAADTAHLNDDQFGEYLRQLQETANHPPTPYHPGVLKGPSTLQLAAGALGAALVPGFAATAVAAPFQAALRDHAQHEQIAQQQAEEARKAWQVQMGAQGDALAAIQRRDEAKMASDARQRIALGNNATRIAAAQLSIAGKASIASVVSHDRELSQAVKLALGADPEVRPTLFENLRIHAPSVFGGLGDDAIEAIGGLLPRVDSAGTGHAIGQSPVGPQEGAVQSFGQAGDFLSAKRVSRKAQAELGRERLSWMSKDSAAGVQRTEATAERARSDANDSFAGLEGARTVSKEQLLRQQRLNEEAQTKGEASLADIDRQIAAVHDRLGLLGTGAVQDGIRAGLVNSLDKLGAVKAEKGLYLKRLQQMQSAVGAALTQFPEQAAAVLAEPPTAGGDKPLVYVGGNPNLTFRVKGRLVTVSQAVSEANAMIQAGVDRAKVVKRLQAAGVTVR